MYLRGPCAHVPGTLPAYAAALLNAARGAVAAPGESFGHLQFRLVGLIRVCRETDIALAVYTDEQGVRFELHINLLRDTAGWQVFDVAEAPPHISPPAPLGRSSRGC